MQQLNSSNRGQSSIFSLPVNNLTDAISLNYKQDRMLNITDTNGGCRTVSFSAKHAAILVSQPSNSPIFPGFGIKKVKPLFKFRFLALNKFNYSTFSYSRSIFLIIKYHNIFQFIANLFEI